MEHKIKIDKEKRLLLISEIKTFFKKERDEDLGDLAADIFLDFIIDKTSTTFYNQGVEDSYNYLNDKLIDLLGIQK